LYQKDKIKTHVAFEGTLPGLLPTNKVLSAETEGDIGRAQETAAPPAVAPESDGRALADVRRRLSKPRSQTGHAAIAMSIDLKAHQQGCIVSTIAEAC